MNCYCDQDLPFADCCEPFLLGQKHAPNPQTLMRSRYSAFASGNAEYLLGTWHKDFRPARVDIDPAQKWLGLKIQHYSDQNDQGEVKFTARYKQNGRGYRLEEHSLFSRIAGRWYYLHELKT